ncbi:MAG TPA: PH domain-containing protein [Elusimicrobiales bacterium]|nr:PH domain-containing protein [Elusimicrobiales bacterium]
MENYFRAEWSNSLVVSTAAVMAALLASFYWTLRMTRAPGLEMRVIGVSLLCITIGVIAYSYLLAPKGYLIGPDRMTIVRALNPIVVPFDAISGAETAGPELFKDSIRVMGSGGFWGYYGKYQSSPLGKYYMYARKTWDLVLVRGRENYVVAPEKPLEFIDSLSRGILSYRSKESAK